MLKWTRTIAALLVISLSLGLVSAASAEIAEYRAVSKALMREVMLILPTSRWDPRPATELTQWAWLGGDGSNETHGTTDPGPVRGLLV